jgi:hypothetical protein
VVKEYTERLSGPSRTFLTRAVARLGRPAAYPMNRTPSDCRLASFAYDTVQSLSWLEVECRECRWLDELRDDEDEPEDEDEAYEEDDADEDGMVVVAVVFLSNYRSDESGRCATAEAPQCKCQPGHIIIP